MKSNEIIKIPAWRLVVPKEVSFKSGVSNPRPAGRMRPTKEFVEVLEATVKYNPLLILKLILIQILDCTYTVKGNNQTSIRHVRSL